MSGYQNPYFKLCIEFPENWKYRFWGNRKNLSECPEHCQSAYDELPSEAYPVKALLHGLRRVKESPTIISMSFGVAALYRPNGIDLSAERPVFESEWVRESGEILILECDGKYIYVEDQCDNYISRIRVYYWPVMPQIWLSCGIRGDTIENFLETEKIFNGIKKIT